MGVAGYRNQPPRRAVLHRSGRLRPAGGLLLGPEPETPPDVDFELVFIASRPLLLEKLNAWFAEHDPDVLIGWNVVQFDLRVLQKHAERYRIPLRLGRQQRAGVA
ncbi:hypothetical protein LNO81_03680 [Klebsiella variicola subsp. variicola]|nr:hypothetical protein [Klebsiella variicola subsp. variicola]